MPDLPSIDVVVIGLNSARTLADCLRSVEASDYPRSLISVIYADGGSSDGSPGIAESLGCACVRVEADSPTPGRQRNAGWRVGSGRFVQFLDSDTIVDPSWLGKAALALSAERVGAVCGDRREMHPERSAYNWIGDLEWNPAPGETEAFGGDALVSRAALEATGGYDPELIAGEDPELSYRIRRAGYEIIKLAEPMTKHDLAMYSLKQYWKRSFRSGHAFAEVHAMHPDFWGRQCLRLSVRCLPFLAGVVLLPLSLASAWLAVPFLAGAVVLLRPRLCLLRKFRDGLSLTEREARLYAWHASLVVLPQYFGLLRYRFGRVLGRPLTNRRMIAGRRA